LHEPARSATESTRQDDVPEVGAERPEGTEGDPHQPSLVGAACDPCGDAEDRQEQGESTSTTKLMKPRITCFLSFGFPVGISMPYWPLPSRFLEFFGSAGAIVGEVLCFDLWAVVCIYMVAVKAPANGLAGLGFSASAFAMGSLLPLLGERGVGLGRHRFCNAPLLRG